MQFRFPGLTLAANAAYHAIYQPFPGTGEPGFYHMKPNTLYDRNHPAAGLAGVLGAEFTTNDLGFRTHPTEKPPGTRRLLVVGDSWTFGPGVDESETFTRRLEGLLAEHAAPPGGAPSRVYGILNYEMSLSHFLEPVGRQRNRCDVVILSADVPAIVASTACFRRKPARC